MRVEIVIGEFRSEAIPGAAISAKNVSKTFGGPIGVTALKEVSFDVADQEFVSVLGPSGSGKSTALRIIGGFLDWDDGEVSVVGQSLDEPFGALDALTRKDPAFGNYVVQLSEIMGVI